MAQRVKVLSATPAYLSLMVPGTYLVERDLTPTSCPLTSTHMPRHTCPPSPTNKQTNKQINVILKFFIRSFFTILYIVYLILPLALPVL